jgi:uncharacterized membrane protein YeaQ/YmgE (transglycosylase-associated protein family)
MTFLIVIAVIGIAGGAFMNSLMDARGTALGLPLSAGAGLVGGFVTGFLFLMFGKFLVGEGPDFILSLFAALAGAIVLVFLVAVIRKKVL